MTMMRRLMPPILVVLAAWLALSPGLDGSFVYDDDFYLAENPAVSGSQSVWTSPLGAPRQGLWRPLTVASFRLQWNGPDQPGPLLSLNLALHALASLLVLALGRKLGMGATPATLAALLFAVHPVHAEAVSWVTGRAEVLATVFVLASLWAHLSDRRWAAPMALVCLALACLSKENALAAPALFLAADLACRPKRIPVRRLLGLGAVSIAIFAARLSVLPQLLPVDGPFTRTDLGGRIVVALNVVGQAFRLMLWPDPLRIEYQKDEFALAGTGSLALLAVALAAGCWLWRRHRMAALGLLWVPLALIPVMHLVPIGEPFAERFLYLPSVGICLALGAGLGAWARRDLAGNRGLGASLMCLAALLALALPTARAAARVFHDDLSLWAHAARIAPDLALARYNHGTFLEIAGHHLRRDKHLPACIDELNASLELEPHHVYAGYAHRLLGGHALGAVGSEPPNPQLAARHLRAAVELLPQSVEARLNLASLALETPDLVNPSEALELLKPLLAGHWADGTRPEPEDQLAAEQIFRQLSGPESSSTTTGTSSSDGS